MGKKIAITIITWFFAFLSTDVMAQTTLNDSLYIAISWIDADAYIRSVIHYRDSVSRKGKPHCIFIKRNEADKALEEFINNRVLLSGNSYSCIFNSEEQIGECSYWGKGGSKTVYYDDEWVIHIHDALFGQSNVSCYVFKRLEDGQFMLAGLAIGEPITSSGWNLTYVIQDSMFCVYSGDGELLLFSNEISEPLLLTHIITS